MCSSGATHEGEFSKQDLLCVDLHMLPLDTGSVYEVSQSESICDCTRILESRGRVRKPQTISQTQIPSTPLFWILCLTQRFSEDKISWLPFWDEQQRRLAAYGHLLMWAAWRMLFTAPLDSLASRALRQEALETLCVMFTVERHGIKNKQTKKLRQQ